ncbi:IS4 family transposase [Oscillibacter sp. MSJ-2]|uniref:IS4 family transposase n=1 Tax=Dysosmobacter acutus TaxID=2841504 RepID=A0ABS6F6L0_9FIRM|nr:IS4 family transposase [Dysosmobacter acutus]MBU5625905.1 IS4 family transposase [Dysosmobacter acutus]
MAYPEIVLSNLDEIINYVEKNSTFARSDKPERNRKVSRADIIKALIFMQGGSLQKELHELGLDISASAFVQRRRQVNAEMMADILTELYARYDAPKTYQGYRVLAMDGTTVNMAYDLNSPCLVSNPSTPKGYCQLHATPLYDILNKSYMCCTIQPQPQQDEIGALDGLLAWYDFDEKTLLVGDRGFASYHLFATIQQKPNADFLIRVKQGRGAMREVAKLPIKELDTEISFTITTTQTKEDKEKGYIFLQTRKKKDRIYSANTRAGRWSYHSPYPMKLRIVRVLLDTGEYETLATSLPPSFTAQQIKELYHARWGIETAFRELKYNYGLVNLHGRSEKFARQEIYASMITASLCSRIISQAVIEQHTGAAHLYQVNQKMAVYLCKKFFRTPGADGEKLMREIAKYIEPVRPGRQDKRNIRAKSFAGFLYRVAA